MTKAPETNAQVAGPAKQIITAEAYAALAAVPGMDLSGFAIAGA